MRAITEEMVSWHLDQWQRGMTIDLNAEFAYPLPANVISTIIGARREDLDKLQHWAEAITTLLLAGVGDDTRLDRAQAGADRVQGLSERSSTTSGSTTRATT
jgi:cytochrome P450